MPTIRLYKAIKDHQDATAIYDAARYTGNYTPAKSLNHASPIISRVQAAHYELTAAMEEAKEIIEAPNDRQRAVAIRIAGEQDIVNFMVKSLFSQGLKIQFNDDDEEQWYSSFDEMKDQLFTMDIDTLNVCFQGSPVEGWISLVYGNSPCEVIADHTTNLDKFLLPTWMYIRSFYDPTFPIDS